MLKNRSTIDIVVILLTATIGVTLICTLLGILLLKILHPDMDTSRGGEAVSNILTTIVGALVGFIGGRATGKYEQQNGKA